MTRRIIFLSLVVLAMPLVTAGVASAAGSWGTACYVQSVTGSTATLRCVVNADPSPAGPHYMVTVHGTGCSSVSGSFGSWCPIITGITPGVVFTASSPSNSSMGVEVWDSVGTYSTSSNLINTCGDCREADLHDGPAAGSGLILDATTATNTIVGIADHAPLVSDQGGGGSTSTGLSGWPAFVGQGFSIGLIIWVFIWGMTLPIRFLLKFIG